MDSLEGMVVQNRLPCAGQFEMMGNIEFCLFGGEPRHVIPHGDSLVERFHDGKLHDAFQIGLTGEDEDEGVVGVHLEIGQQPEFFEGAGLEKMSLVDDEKDGPTRTVPGFQKGLLDLAVDGALGESGRQPEEAVDVIQEICPAQGGKGSIVGFEQILIESVHVATEGEGFAYPGISGQKQDAAAAFDIVKPGQGFLEGLCFEDILGLEVLIKRKRLEPKPSQ
jgi:hypothetical protein